jgi:alpha-L-rhamnosidase
VLRTLAQKRKGDRLRNYANTLLDASFNRRKFLACSAATAITLFRPLPKVLWANGVEPNSQQPTQESVATAFRVAKPIWPDGRETEMNLFVGFRAVFNLPPGKQAFLRVAASTLYRTFVNGKFHAWGPARGPHGYYRVDLWEITPLLAKGTNLMAIEVAGYNINSYWILNQPSFLQAEVVTDTEVLASTGGDVRLFEAAILSERVRKVQRYSFQRAFSEVYRLEPATTAWRTQPKAQFKRVNCIASEARKLIPRRVPYPVFAKRQPEKLTSQGLFASDIHVQNLYRGRSLTEIGPLLLCFHESELEVIPFLELQKIATTANHSVNALYRWDQPLPLIAGQFWILAQN